MRSRLLALTVFLLVVPALQAQGDASWRTVDCRRALDVLQVQESAAAMASKAGRPPDAARQQADRTRIEMLRRRAAHACLGAGAARVPPSGRLAEPGIAVSPVEVPPLGARPSLRPPPAPLPPLRVEPPLTVMSCDAAGCWASDGSRLQQVGPQLLGPRGFCSRQANVLQCP